jgi:CubicO group peptidase (beta-lactamase class C family)
VNVDGQMMQSVSGGGHFGGGLFINTYDMARFGLLFLRDGKWNQQQLISEQWINAMQQPSAANKEYGFLWWLNTNNAFKSLPASVYSANGFGGNFIVVDKTNDLVVVTRWLEPSTLSDFLQLVVKAVDKK